MCCETNIFHNIPDTNTFLVYFCMVCNYSLIPNLSCLLHLPCIATLFMYLCEKRMKRLLNWFSMSSFQFWWSVLGRRFARFKVNNIFIAPLLTHAFALYLAALL